MAQNVQQRNLLKIQLWGRQCNKDEPDDNIKQDPMIYIHMNKYLYINLNRYNNLSLYIYVQQRLFFFKKVIITLQWSNVLTSIYEE